jgi:hypothetical protein
MASTIQLKTGTGSAVPSSLTQGELAINIDNGLIYYGSGSENTRKQLESFTNITASANISASGYLVVQNITASSNISASGYLVVQNITASSNISASGYIYGRQFEQLDSVCNAVNLDTSPIYVPLGGQSLLEQTLTTHNNVQKLAIATGKPRKVIMRNMIGGGIKFGNTGFTCSYWSQLPETGTVSLIGAKYANGISASHEAITFDFTTGINSGSWSDVTPGSKVYMSLKADIALDVNPISSLGVASLWEWDYNA